MNISQKRKDHLYEQMTAGIIALRGKNLRQKEPMSKEKLDEELYKLELKTWRRICYALNIEE